MLKTCGIEIKSNTAILVALEIIDDNPTIIQTELKKISINDSNSQNDVKSFYNAINNFFKAHDFDKIGIKARATKGKFIGGATTFKIEGLIQNTDYEVIILHGHTIKAEIKNVALDYSLVNNYQVEAMKVAYCLTLQ